MEKLCKSTDWDIMSISNEGEAVLASNVNNNLVIAKVRSFSKITDVDKVREIHLSELTREVTVTDSIVNECLTIDDAVWETHLISIKHDPFEYVLYMDTCLNDDVCVVELLFSSAEDYLDFSDKIPEFIESIDFHQLRREYGCVTCEDMNVKATAISNMIFVGLNSNNMMVFVGKDKYITVSVSTTSQRGALQEELSKNDMVFIDTSVTDGMPYERYRVFNNEHKEMGTLEFCTKQVGMVYIELFGYCRFKTNSFIANDLKLEIDQTR